ncbi:unnamed protein product [Effrenium voratum]|uniref:Ricin B lectin domain-containing protein n=1 Tax=Effrenium voratum TaxID=2562239 RepID=A0AA36MLF8_9DINO|nr:unnamed protein product [Effrenium voratum]
MTVAWGKQPRCPLLGSHSQETAPSMLPRPHAWSDCTGPLARPPACTCAVPTRPSSWELPAGGWPFWLQAYFPFAPQPRRRRAPKSVLLMSLKLVLCLLAARAGADPVLLADDECKDGAETCALQALQFRGQKVATLTEDDCSSGELPSTGELCYDGTLLVETFNVKVIKSAGSSGTLDMKAVGPIQGQCKGADFQMNGNELTVDGLETCGITGAEYKVKYCANTDQFVVQVIKPMAIDVVLKRSTCAASLAAVAVPAPVAPMGLVAQAESEQLGCSGYGKFPKGHLCYKGTFLVETFYVKISSSNGESGRVDVKAVGPKQGSCYGVGFRKHGQTVSLNYAKCGFDGLAFSVNYCSSNDKIDVRVTSPMAANVMLSRTWCGVGSSMEENTTDTDAAEMALADLTEEETEQLDQMEQVQQREIDQSNGEMDDCSSGELPSTGELCYDGTLLVETFNVKVIKSAGSSGTLDMKAVGPIQGQCKGADFQMNGNELTVDGLETCGITGAEYKVKYCANTDQFVVQVIKPMAIDVVLKRSTCAASLAAVAVPAPVAPMGLVAQAESEQLGCSGYGKFPKGHLCYKGTFLVETFYVKISSSNGESGRVDVKAVGPKQGSCYGVGFRKHGQTVSLNYAKCGFDGLAFSVNYCSSNDKIDVRVTSPMAANVMLSRTWCGVGSSMEENITDADVKSDELALADFANEQTDQSFQLAAQMEDDCSSGELPSDGELCYEGTLLVETFSVKVLKSAGSSGTLDMSAVGPIAGHCKNAGFEMTGNDVTVDGLETCGITGAEYKVKYCANTDRLVVKVMKPMTIDVVLNRTKCATVTSDGTCVKESEVPCCPDGSCTDRCTGTQCCPSAEGSRTCPSASTVEVSICALGKKYDCTGTTGIAPPGRVDGECEFPNPPAMGYYWDPFCFFGQLGCFADGVNVECRFCGDGAFAEVTCVTTTTTTAATTTVSTTITTTTAGECAALGGGLKQCSDDGCTVLAGGMLSRTCRQYCLEHHLDCVAAWEDSDDDCNILASLTCDQIYDGTPDLICQCAPLPPPPAVWIQNAQGHCLMAQEFNRSGAAVKLHPCLDPAVPAEQWIHFPSGQLKNPREDMRCLHVAELNTPGSLLVMWQCSADEPAQNFTMDAETGQMRIGGLCLESRSGAEILDVVTAACGASSNQFFQWGESQYMTTTTTTVGWTDGVWGRPTSSSSGLWQHREGHCVSSQLLMANCDATSAAQFFAYNQSLLQIAAGGLCLEAESSSGGLSMRTCDPTSEAQHFAYNVHAGLVWNRQSQCVTAADPFQTGLSLHLEPCNATKNSQLWFLNSIATTTLAPVRVGFHVLQQNGLCLAAKDNSSRSCLEMRQCKKEDDAQLWFYNEQWHHFENGFGKCLMAPHAGGVLKAKISFTPVDGGESRACRGTSASDFGSSNYLPFLGIDSLDTCKDLCRERASCTGIEFNPFMKRCEVWIKPVGMTVGAYNFSCYAASLEDPTLAIFEAVDGGVGRVCRGDNPGDNAASYYTQSWAESQEDCQRQCSMATGHCTGFEFHKFGRCELWSKPVGSSAGISGYSCRALATVIMQDCNSSDFRQMWQMDNEGHISSLKDGACLDAVNDGVGGRVRLLTCSAMDASRTWSTETVQVEQQNAVTS